MLKRYIFRLTKTGILPRISLDEALDETGSALIRSAMRQLQLSARAYHQVLKLARTIADLAGSEGIQPQHLADALQYRLRSIGN